MSIEEKLVNQLKVNDIALLKVNEEKRPCLVEGYDSAKMGKHGFAKIFLKAFDVFTGRKIAKTMRADEKVEVVLNLYQHFEICDIRNCSIDVFDKNDDIMSDFCVCSEQMGKDINNALEKDKTVSANFAVWKNETKIIKLFISDEL